MRKVRRSLFTIGPDLGQGADREFEEDPALLKGWRQTLYERGSVSEWAVGASSGGRR